MGAVLVTGATGTVGRAVVDTLARADETVRGTSRDPDPDSAVAGTLDEFVGADFRHPETLREALSGVDRAFLLTPDGPEQVALKSNFIHEADRAGVESVTNLSVRGAALDAPEGIGRQHRLAEIQLEASDAASVHVRPTFLMQNLARHLADSIRQGKIVLPFGDGEFSLVDARDVGAVVATTLLDSDHREGPYLVSGPEAMDFGDVADRLSTVLDRRIEYVPVPPGEFRQSMLERGQPPWLANQFVELAAAAREGLTSPVTDAVHEVTGSEPQDIEAFARDHADELGADR